MAYWLPDQQLIYIHPYKTGGTSIRSVLSKGGKEIVHKHATCEEVRIWMAMAGYSVEWQKARKIVTVRNPWAWMVSLYEFISRVQGHFLHEVVSQMDFPQFVNFFRGQMRPGNPLTEDFHHLMPSQFITTGCEVIKIEDEQAVREVFGQIPRKNVTEKQADYWSDVDVEDIDFLIEEAETLGYEKTPNISR